MYNVTCIYNVVYVCSIVEVVDGVTYLCACNVDDQYQMNWSASYNVLYFVVCVGLSSHTHTCTHTLRCVMGCE